MYALRMIAMLMTMLYTFVVLSVFTVQTVPQTAAAAAQEPISLGQSSPITVNILHPYSNKGLAMQQAADLFMQEHPDVQIRIQSVEGSAEYRAALRARLLAGDQVDLFHLYGELELQELRTYASDLSSLPWIENAAGGVLSPMLHDDGIYGVPWALEGMGLVANRSIFYAANLSLSDVESFQDLEDSLRELRSLIDSGELSESFPALTHVTEFPALDMSFLAEQVSELALSGAFLSAHQAANAKLLSLPASNALEQYIILMARLSSSRADWEMLNAVPGNRQVEEGIASERIAIVQQQTTIYSRVANINQELADNLALLPVPLDGAENPSVYVGAPSYWAVNARSSNESAAVAMEFLTWLYCSELGTNLLANQFDLLSPYQEFARDTGNPLHQQLLRYIQREEYLPWLHQEAPDGWCVEVFAEGLREYFSSDALDWSLFDQSLTTEWPRRR